MNLLQHQCLFPNLKFSHNNLLKQCIASAIIILSCNTSIWAQAILKGNIVHQVANIPVQYIPPIKGMFFLSGYKECTIAADGNFNATMVTVDTPSIVSFYCNNAYWRIFTAPNATDSVWLDLEQPKNIQFYGTNAAVNSFLNHTLKREKYFSGFAETPTEQSLMEDLRAAVVEDRILKMQNAELKALNDFNAAHHLPASLYEAIQADILYYHQALFNSITLSVYKPLLKGNDIITPFDEQWATIWTKQMEDAKHFNNDKALQTYWYHDFMDKFVDWYRGSFKKDIDLSRLDLKKGENIFEIEQLIRQYFSGKALESALADMIYEEAVQENMQPSLISIYNRFATDFPNSPYHAYLRQALAPIEKNWANDNSNLLTSTGEIYLINNAENINTLSDLIQLFKGKVVYVDLWATWCGPCKQEFQYKDELEAFSKGKSIEKLFVSINKAEKDQAWQDAISFYDLNGHHIRANNALIADLRKHYTQDDKGTLTIPRYLIFDKNGKLAHKDAPRPSEREKLYKLLEKLNN